jgi:predicted transcriptional regulator
MSTLKVGPCGENRTAHKILSISWSLLLKYLDYLVSEGFLNRLWSLTGKRRIYRVTGKGLEFLRAFKALKEQILLINE